MGFFAKRNTPLILRLDPRHLCRDNRVRPQTEQEESLASLEDDDVVGFTTVWIEERPGTIRIDRVASVRSGLIGPVPDCTVDARGSANGAALPISVEEGDAKLGDRARHGIVYARVEEGIGPFETGNATAALRRGMDLSSVIQRCDHDCDAEQC